MALGQQTKLLLVLFIACCALCVSAQSNTFTCISVFNHNYTTPAGLTQFQINYPSELNNLVKIEYYTSSTNDIDVDVQWGSNDNNLIATFKTLTANVTNQVDRVLLSLGLIPNQRSAASKANVAFPLTLLTAILASVFLLPNSRITGALILCAICVAMCTPVFADCGLNVVTVRVGLPPQITQICENNVCHGWTSSSSSASGATVSNPSSSSTGATTSNPSSGATTSNPSSGVTGTLATSSTATGVTSSSPSAGDSSSSASVSGATSQASTAALSGTDSGAATTGDTVASGTTATTSPSSSVSTINGATSAPATTGDTSAAAITSGASSTGTVATGAATTAAVTTGAATTTGAASITGSTTTSSPTSSPASLHFRLKVLIMGGATAKVSTFGVDFAAIAFDSVGMPYDFISVTSTLDLTSYLSTTSDTGLYSGIVSVYNAAGVDPLTDAQNAVVVAYQKKYGVKLVVVSALSTSKTYPGVTIGKTATTTEYYQVTLAPQFAQYGQFLNQSISVNTLDVVLYSAYTNTKCTVLNVQITDTSIVTPVLIAHPSTGPTVAAAVFKNADGTEVLRYFMAEGADYFHSMAFSNVMTNWISPGGLFIGMRRLIFTVQPDDLFLGSYTWNTTTHSNPLGFFYRITADDLQNLADFFDTINPLLPSGSYVTVEWPVNFGGVNNSYYLKGAPVDDLYNKAREIIDKFYYLSHTWDHPCPGAAIGNFDQKDNAAGYTLANSELSQNIAFVPKFFATDKLHLWSNASMITPCLTGLYNAGVLKAMNDNGITSCVSDEGITNKNTIDYEPLVPYHGQYSTIERNGYIGVYFVPRQTLDIDYDVRTPADAIDQYKADKGKNDPKYNTFEEYFVQERLLATQLMVAFRWDPYMMHQTNAFKFTYNDPTPNPHFNFGSSYDTSMVALWMQRVLGDMLSFYNLPIVTKQMDDLTDMFLQRQTMDGCGINAILGVDSSNNIIDISVTSASACTMTLSGGVTISGSTVTTEQVGSESTAYISLTGSGTQQFTLATPIPVKK